MSFKAIIIDDEKAARTLLQAMIEKYCKDIEIVATCEDLPNGVKSIRKLKPDLVLLDIEMPGHSGLELLEFFNEDEVTFSIIFTTAYNNYAIQAFKLSAIDYLLKPIEREELIKSIERFKKHNHKNDLSILKENIQEAQPQKLALPTGSSVKFVNLNEVLFFKADGSYTHITLANGDKVMVSKPLKTYEELLENNKNFIRSHKSFIVNIHHVTDLVKSEGGYLKVQNNYEVGLSPEKSDEVMEQLNILRK